MSPAKHRSRKLISSNIGVLIFIANGMKLIRERGKQSAMQQLLAAYPETDQRKREAVSQTIGQPV